MVSCGGGDSSTTSSASVSLINVRISPIEDEIYDNGNPAWKMLSPIRITADAQGDLTTLNGRTLYISVEDPDGFVESAALQTSVSASGNVLQIEPKTFGPPPGRYTRGLRVFVCLDSACAQQLAGSPIAVPYDITVLQGLKINSNTLVSLASTPNTPTQVQVPITLPVGLRTYESPHSQAGEPWVEKGAIFFQPAIDWQIALGATPTATIVGNPAVAGIYSTTLSLHAQVISPRGRPLRLTAQVPVSYTVAP